MNYRVVCAFLGVVAVFLGVCMFLCLPWSSPLFGGDWRFESRGAFGLTTGALTSFLTGIAFFWFGRGADSSRLFRKEAIAIVVLSWILAIVLGATPYLFSGSQRAPGVPLTVADALFESASGFTTTGATILSELEDPSSLPRTILFWRCATHFLGGLGVMCFFVVLLGQGARGKAIMRLEHNLSGSVPIAKMRGLAFSLFTIYLGLNVFCSIALLSFGVSFFDAIAHSFSVVANGGFSSFNASVGHFTVDPNVNGVGIELTLITFMLLAATNFWLLYWCALGKPGKMFRDSEWRTFIGIVLIGTILAFSFGVFKRDFDRYGTAGAPLATTQTTKESDNLRDVDAISKAIREQTSTNESEETKEEDETVSWPTALRLAAFNVVSLATGAGFVTDQFELWNATTLTMIVILMFCGGCSGSSAGGAKIFRILLAVKSLFREPERLHSPNVVRATRLDGENVDKETTSAVFTFLTAYIFLIVATSLLVSAIEPDDLWTARGASQIEKFIDIGTGTLSMYSNVGPGFGGFGARENFGGLTAMTKIIYCWAMLLGRLEIWAVLALFSPAFWRNR